MEHLWVKILVAVVYIIFSVIVWAIGLYLSHITTEKYNEDIYDVDNVEKLGKYVSAKRLLAGCVLVLASIFLWTRIVDPLWLLLYGQLGILGIAFLITSIREHEVLHLVPIYPGISKSKCINDEAITGCWGPIVVLVSIIVCALVAVFL